MRSCGAIRPSLAAAVVLGACLLAPAAARSEVVFEQRWGTIGGGQGQLLGAPAGIATAPAGDVLVTDPVASKVKVFGPSGNFLRQWGGFGAGDGQFLGGPRAIDVAPSGTVFVADPGNYRVQAFEPDGDFIRAFGSQGAGEGQFTGTIAGIAADSAGHVVVAEGGLTEGGHRIHVFDAQGIFIRRWGGFGSSDGRFWSPAGVAVNPASGQLFVADSANWRVQAFNLGGAFIRRWGRCCAGDGQFGSPEGLDLDPLGRVLVSDPSRARIQQFLPSGAFIRKWSSCCGAPSWEVSDLAATRSGKIYALDSAPAATGSYARVQRFGIVPATRIDSGPGRLTSDDTPSFAFSADEPLATFKCRIDPGPWTGCASPRTLAGLADGSYRFLVQATDSLGTADPTPATSEFTVDTVVGGSVRAKRRQRQRGRRIAVTVEIEAVEALAATVKGKIRGRRTYKLKPAKREVAASGAKKIKLKPRRKRDARRIVRLLRRGKRLPVSLQARLSDGLGNRAEIGLRVRLSS